MRLAEIIKYNGALFLTGLFSVFISATVSGGLLVNSESGHFIFISTGCIALGGVSLGLFAGRGYRGRADFVPDYFILILPVTALLVLFSASSLYWELLELYSFIWGFSLGVCFSMLIRVNPSARFTGYPLFTLGAFCGGILSMPVLSGQWHVCDVFAVLSLLVAMMPPVCFFSSLKSRRGILLTAALGLCVSTLTVSQSMKIKEYDRMTREYKSESAAAIANGVSDEAITAFIPVLLQPDFHVLKILLSEHERSNLAGKLSKLPFVAQIIRSRNDRIHRYHRPFAFRNELRKILTINVNAMEGLEDGYPHEFNVLMVVTADPLSAGNNHLFTREFYRIASRFIIPGGIFVTTAADLRQAAVIAKAMDKSFSHVKIFPGRNEREIVIVAANTELSSDYDYLDRKALFRFEHLGFCRGMLPQLLPPVEQYDIENKTDRMLDSLPVNSDINPYYINRDLSHLSGKIPWPVFAGIFAVYLLARTLLSRKTSRAMAFRSLENGVYCGGMLIICLLLFQSIEGQLFLYLGWLAAIFLIGSACGFGIRTDRILVVRGIVLISCLLPPALLLYSGTVFQEHCLVIICVAMFIIGISGGVTMALCASRRGRMFQRYDFLNWTIAGIALGGGLCWLFLTIPAFLLPACVIMLVAAKLPVLRYR